jgi:hypothetical protein
MPQPCFVAFWLALLFPALADRFAKTFVVFGARLSEAAETGTTTQGASVLSRSCSRRDRLPVGAMRGAGAGAHPGPAPLLSRASRGLSQRDQALPLTVRRGRCLLEPVNLRIIVRIEF